MAGNVAVRLAGDVKSLLEKRGVQYKILEHDVDTVLSDTIVDLGIAPDSVLRTVLLKDAAGRLMLLIPANQVVDIAKLRQLLQRDLQSIQPEELAAGKNHAQGAFPPIPGYYKAEVIADATIEHCDPLYVQLSQNCPLVEMTPNDFNAMVGELIYVEAGEVIEDAPQGPDPANPLHVMRDKFVQRRMKVRVEETLELPTMPEIAQQLLQVRVDPHAHAGELATIIEKEPSLSAQIVSWARSPYYGFGGKIESVEDAVIRVLGFDLVMNLAIGISLGKAFNVPLDGPLGLRNYWLNAIYTACLVQNLVELIPLPQRPLRGLAYLSGLLHNFGHLLLGHLFPAQFKVLNENVTLNDHVSLHHIEQHTLGVSNDCVGAWLMKAWRMPEEIITAVRWHQHALADHKHANYSNLVYVALRLLKRHGIGHANSERIAPELFQTLGLPEGKAMERLDAFMEHKSEIDGLAQQMMN